MYVAGIYNELYYYIDIVDNDGIPNTVYKAGNSPFEAQEYLPAEEGIGLKSMKKMCTQAANSVARNNNTKVGVIMYEDPT